MKVLVNDAEILGLSDIQKKVICNDIHVDQFDEDINRRVKYIIMHKYEQCFKRLKEEWDSKLISNGVRSVPTDPEEYAALVFAQPNYKDRKARDAENKQLGA